MAVLQYIEREKENAIQAGVFLARSGLFLNSPDIAQVVTHANTGTVSAITVGTAPLLNAAIIGITTANTVSAKFVVFDLGDMTKYFIKKPFVIDVQQIDGDEWVATLPEAELARSGETPTDAIDWLKSSMVQLYELFRGEDQLGPLPQKQLRVLEQYLGKKSHRTR